MFERYAIIDQRDIADAMQKLQASEKTVANDYRTTTAQPAGSTVAKGGVVN
jgi:hypothetical protein